MKYTNTIIDCERMKHPYTGLYNYCYHLGNALAQEAINNGDELAFYVPRNCVGIFGGNQTYYCQQEWHKLYLPSFKKNSIWHSTSQGSAYFPFNKKVPVVLTIHDINIVHNESKSAGEKSAVINALEKRIHLCSHITFISSFTLNDVKKYINIDGKPVSVIHNGCNVQEIKNPLQPSFVPKAPYYFTLGTIMEKKKLSCVASVA